MKPRVGHTGSECQEEKNLNLASFNEDFPPQKIAFIKNEYSKWLDIWYCTDILWCYVMSTSWHHFASLRTSQLKLKFELMREWETRERQREHRASSDSFEICQEKKWSKYTVKQCVFGIVKSNNSFLYLHQLPRISSNINSRLKV